MEKKKPHYSLDLIKELISQDQWRITRQAYITAYKDFEFVDEDILKVILGLAPKDFYKSMTSYDNFKLWQDVYRPKIQSTGAYIKLNILDENTVIISFKKR